MSKLSLKPLVLGAILAVSTAYPTTASPFNSVSSFSSGSCSTKIVNLPGLKTSFFIPPHTEGDREFHGNGPFVDVSVSLEESHTGINLKMYMQAKEKNPDYTSVEGYRTETIYTPPNGWKVKQILGDNYSAYQYRDSDHDDDVFSMGSSELVNRFVIVGDRHGEDAGIHTGFQAFLNIVEVELIETENCTN